MSRIGLIIRRGVAAAAAALGKPGDTIDSAAPQRILRGDAVRHGRVFLAGASTIWTARKLVERTGHGAPELWLGWAPVLYELDERAEVRVEFANGLVLMAVARREHDAMRLTPLRRELAPLDLVLDPSSGQTPAGPTSA